MDGPFGEKTAGKYIAGALAQFSVVLLRQYGPGPLLADRLGHLEDDLLAPLLRLARTVVLVERDAAFLYFLFGKVYILITYLYLSVLSPSRPLPAPVWRGRTASPAPPPCRPPWAPRSSPWCSSAWVPRRKAGPGAWSGARWAPAKEFGERAKNPDVIKCWALFFRSRRVCKGWARVP